MKALLFSGSTCLGRHGLCPSQGLCQSLEHRAQELVRGIFQRQPTGQAMASLVRHAQFSGSELACDFPLGR